MTKKRLPWKLRGSDFNEPGWSTRPTVGYELFFEFLRLSPSYELARKASEEELTAEEKKSLPSDFRDVQKTYAMLGNVQTTLYRQWWLSRGLRTFGNPHKRPAVHQIAELKGGVDVSASAVLDGLDQLLSTTRRDEGLAPALLLSVPLGQRKSDVLRQFSRLLDKYAEVSGTTQPPKLKGGADKNLDYQEVVHVFVRRQDASSRALHQAWPTRQTNHPAAGLPNQKRLEGLVSGI